MKEGAIHMEEILKEILHGMNDIKSQLSEIDQSVKILEKKMDRIEKLNSIEHRVEVNQIDITDIKELVEKMDSFQREHMKDFFDFLKGTSIKIFNEELNQINHRLNAQLKKIAKNEEAIMMMEEKHNRVG
jgi:DNA repair exonuclease SbcCD ATPase subunit